MRRIASGLVLAAAITAPALAQDFDDWGWTRTELPSGARVWIATEDVNSARHGAPVVRVLRTAGSRPGAYLVDAYTFACDGGVTVRTISWGRDGPSLEPEPRPEREVRRGGVEGDLFDIACEGAEPLTDVEVGSAREALAYDRDGQDGGDSPPPRPRSWDSGPGGPEREPVESREPPPPDDE